MAAAAAASGVGAGAAAGAGAGVDGDIAVAGYKYPLQHVTLWSAAEVKMVRDVFVVDLDWSNMPAKFGQRVCTRHEFGLGDETRRFRVEVAAREAKLSIQLQVHETVMARCLGLHWTLPDFVEPHEARSFACNGRRRDEKDPEWYSSKSQSFEPNRSLRQLRVAIATFFPIPVAADIAYLQQASQGMFDSRRHCGPALVLTADGKKIEVDKGVMKASGYVPLAAPFCDVAFQTARMSRPEVAWDLNHNAALLVVKAIYLGPSRAWAGVVTSDEHVDMWMSILAFVQSMLMTAFVPPATRLVKRCTSARVYAKVLASALRNGWTDILTELEIHAKRDTGAVLASFAAQGTPMPTAPVAAAAAACASTAPAVMPRDPNAATVLISDIRVELDKLEHGSWEMTPVYELPGSRSIKFRVMFQRWDAGDPDIRVAFAYSTVDDNALSALTFWIPELKLGPVTFSDSNEKFEMGTQSQDETLGDDWHIARYWAGNRHGNPEKISLRVTAYYDANVTSSAEDDQLHRAERMLAMARDAEHVDIALLGSNAGAKDGRSVAAFAHAVILAPHSKELAQLVHDVPCPVAAVAARSGDATTVLDRCREIRLDATTGAIMLLRDALYHDGELLPSLLASERTTLDDVADLVALCKQLNPTGRSGAFNRLEALTRAAFLKRITGHTLADVLEMTKLPKYAALRQIAENFVRTHPEVLSVLVYSSADPKSRPPRRAAAAAAAAAVMTSGSSGAGAKRASNGAACEGPAAKKSRVDPAAAAAATPAPAAAAAAAARSLEDDDE